VNNLHWTALIEAVVLGQGGPCHVTTLRALVEAGADERLTNRDGRTALDLARARGHGEVVGNVKLLACRRGSSDTNHVLEMF
jgi:uncharacterized protein